MNPNPPMVTCPACGGKSLFAPSNPARPFCSLRCKQIDFGAWASENFRVSGELKDLDPSEWADLSNAAQTRH